MHNIVEIKNINFFEVFKNFNMNIQRNRLISLSGPNNCGKTSLIKILTRKENVTGEIIFQDNNINDYKITDYNRIVKSVIPLQEMMINETVDEELNYHLDQLFLNKEEKTKRLKNINKNLCLNKIKKKNIRELSEKEFISLQIASAIAMMPKLLLIDDLTVYFDNIEVKRIISYFRYLIKNYDITILINSTRLEDVLEADELYIISNSEIILNGKPIEILQRDNILNKAGIRVPFMIDLSVKLKDYNLIDDVELDINRMINKLWN